MTNLPESAYRLFDEPKDVTIITIDPDGTPQASLVWAHRDGDEILIGVEAKHRKTRNLQRDPRITVLIQDDRKSERDLTQYLVIRGTAKLEGPGIAADYLALMNTQSQRYLGLPEFPFGSPEAFEHAMIIRVTPDKVTGEGPWANH
jgi:PPOX class probable F420-dependent enzyme